VQTDAAAFTIGRDLFFAPPRYDPDSFAGRRLLAHELAHVVQQSRAGEAAGSLAGVELQARSAAALVMNGQRARALGTAPLAVARDEPADADRKTVPLSKAMRTLPWHWAASKASDPKGAGVQISYQQIAPTILERAEARGIGAAQALFLVAQALIEEIANTRAPEKSDYRIFNLMPTDPELAAWRKNAPREDVLAFESGKGVPFSPRRGINVEKFSSDEAVAGGKEKRRSPFFTYQSLEQSVDHMLNRLSGSSKGWYVPSEDGATRKDIAARQKAYAESGASAALRDPSGKVLDYGAALKKIGYATAPDYKEQLNNRYLLVLDDFIQMIEDVQKGTSVSPYVTSPEWLAAYESLETHRQALLAARGNTTFIAIAKPQKAPAAAK